MTCYEGIMHEKLTATAEAEPDTLYDTIKPVLELGLPFTHMSVSDGWHAWPTLPELFYKSFPGVTTSRDAFLVDTDFDRLKVRVTDYFNPELSHEEITRRHPAVMDAVPGFVPPQVRNALLKCATPSLPVEDRLRQASSPMSTGLSIVAGSTGKRIRSSSTQSAPSTNRMCSRATYGW